MRFVWLQISRQRWHRWAWMRHFSI